MSAEAGRRAGKSFATVIGANFPSQQFQVFAPCFHSTDTVSDRILDGCRDRAHVALNMLPRNLDQIAFIAGSARPLPFKGDTER